MPVGQTPARPGPGHEQDVRELWQVLEPIAGAEVTRALAEKRERQKERPILLARNCLVPVARYLIFKTCRVADKAEFDCRYKYIRATRNFYSDASVLAPKLHSYGILIANTVRGYIQSVRYLSSQHTCCTEGGT